MFHSLKRFWLVWVLLLGGTQSMFGFALLGPFNEAFQVATIGYNLPGDIGAPKNIAQGYRWNTPNIYYAYDANFIDFFGSNGMAAVDAAFATFNNLSNVDSYDYGLTNWPQTSLRLNYTAAALSLYDLKSATMQLLMEQLGLAAPQRWIYCLHDRILPSGSVCPAYEYLVIQRNYDPVTQVYSTSVNGTGYGFFVAEECALSPDPFPYEADAVEYAPDPAAYANGQTFAVADFDLNLGQFFTSLTQDDVGGLRYLYSSNRINKEITEPNTLEYYTNFNNEQFLVTSNLALLTEQSLTNNPTNLLALYPNLLITSTSNFFTNLVTTNVTAFFYYPPGAQAGTFQVEFITNYTTNVAFLYAYTFGNVVTNHYYTNGFVTTSVTNVGFNQGGQAGIPVTNVVNTTVFTQFVNGDYYIIPTNFCGIDTNFNNVQLATVVSVTNTLGTNGTNVTGGITNGQSTAFNVITYYTNYSLLYYPIDCDSNNAVELREGVEKINFIRHDYDSLLSGIWTPITNLYQLTQVTNSAPLVQTYQRIVTQPDILITASDLASGPNGLPIDEYAGRGINFNSTQVSSNLAGPGTIQPSTSFTYNEVGPVYGGQNPAFTDGTGSLLFEWGSFDGTTNAPIVYPSTVSLSNLLSEIFFQIATNSPPEASIRTNTAGNPYNFQFNATGGTPPYTWSLVTNTPALPPGLSLSPSGDISGVPTTTGIYDFEVQATDAGSRITQREFSLEVVP